MNEEEIVIRYETIFDFLRREKTRSELQSLPKNFSIKVIEYINEKNELLKGVANKEKEISYVEKQKLSRELDNFPKLLTELHEKRERKVMDMVLLKLKTKNLPPDANNMTDAEHDFFKELESTLNRTRIEVLRDIYSRTVSGNADADTNNENKEQETSNTITNPNINNNDNNKINDASTKEATPIKKENDSMMMLNVEFTREMDKFIGPNLEHYGPYEIGDIATLPKIIVDILKKNDSVKEIE